LCRRSFEKETTTSKIAGIITGYLTLRYLVISGFLNIYQKKNGDS